MARRPGYGLLLLLERMTSELEYYAARMRRRAGMRRTDMHAVAAVVDAERDGEEMTPGRLGTMLGLSSSSVTALVDRLCEAGHLDRGAARTDARRVALHANDIGRQVGEELFEPLDHALMEVFARHSPAELELFGRIVGEITDATAGAGAPVRQIGSVRKSARKHGRPTGSGHATAGNNGSAGSNGAALPGRNPDRDADGARDDGAS